MVLLCLPGQMRLCAFVREPAFLVCTTFVLCVYYTTSMNTKEILLSTAVFTRISSPKKIVLTMIVILAIVRTMILRVISEKIRVRKERQLQKQLR